MLFIACVELEWFIFYKNSAIISCFDRFGLTVIKKKEKKEIIFKGVTDVFVQLKKKEKKNKIVLKVWDIEKKEDFFFDKEEKLLSWNIYFLEKIEKVHVLKKWKLFYWGFLICEYSFF